MRVIVPDYLQREQWDQEISKAVGEVLYKHYPGYRWAVHCDSHNGVVDVRNLTLSGKWGFRMMLRNMSTPRSLEQETVRAGGEILERYRVHRGKINGEEIADLPRNFAGYIEHAS